MAKLSRAKIITKVYESNGTFMSLTFKKKNGDMRKLTGRTGVHIGLKGGKNNVVREDNSYITLYDKDKQAYRTVNLDTVTRVAVNKKVYEVV